MDKVKLISTFSVCLFAVFFSEASDMVFKKVSPSVVSISDAEGGGSGVVLSANGLILTNYHVVSSPLPISVTTKVKVIASGKVETRVFKEVKVTKVHPEYDLALLQIDDKSVRFAPAKLLSKQNEVGPGSQCFVIGNPSGGSAGVLNHTITSGLISSAKREIDGLNYIQTSAAINPGNSGGAICSASGEVFGIVTFKIEGREGIGFAIPTKGLAMNKFVDPNSREKGDIQVAIKLQKQGNQYLNEAHLTLDPESANILRRLGLFFHRLALSEYRGDAVVFYNVARSYLSLEKEDVAVHYLKAALEVEPNFSPACNHLGVYYSKGNNMADAVAAWQSGALDEKRIDSQASCISKLASLYFNEKDYLSSAYLLKWANSLNASAGVELTRRRLIGRELPKLIAAESAQFLAAKSSGFGFEEMKLFANSKLDLNVKNPKSPQQMSRGLVIGISGFVADNSPRRTVRKRIDESRIYAFEDGPKGMVLEGNQIIWIIPTSSTESKGIALLSYQENGVYQYMKVEVDTQE